MTKPGKKKLLLLATFAIAVCVLFFTQFEYFIDNEKSGLSGFVTENHSNPIMEGSTAEFSVVAQSKAHSVSLLLVPPAEKGGQDVILSVYSTDAQPIFMYNISEKQYADGRFITVPLGFTGEKGTEYRITLQSNETDVMKATRLVVGSANKSDVSTWSIAGEINSTVPALSLIYDDVKTMSVLIVIATLMVIAYTAFAIVIKGRNKVLDNIVDFGSLCVSLAVILVSLYVIEMLQWANLLGFSFKVIAANITVVLGIAVLLYTITGKISSAVSLSAIFSLLLGIANHYLIEFRGTVLLPSDITGVSTAAKVAHSYTFVLSDSVLCAIAIIISALAFMFYPVEKSDRKIRKTVLSRCLSFVLGAIMLVVPATRPDLFGTEVCLWKQQTGSRTMNGFVYNFAVNVPLLVRQKPEGYDVSQLEKFVEVNKTQTNETNARITRSQKPNLIFIMNESFADPRTILDIKDADKLLPNLDKLKNDPAAFVGQTAVSVFGGGTSCSEYEMLTGFSIRTDNANTAPYLTYFHENTPSLVWLLNKAGYNTSSYHRATSRNWYRNTAYPNIGFNRTIFLDESNNTLVDSADYLTGNELEFNSMYSKFPADNTGYNIVMNIMEKTEEPVMNFHITMRNHGGYPDADAVYDYSKDEWCTYLKLMNRSDSQLGELLAALSEFDEPTVVVFFGDHWSYFDENKLGSAGLSLDTMTEKQRIDYYSAPYIVWSNCGYDFSSMPEQTSLSYLSSLVMHQLGFDLTPWQNFLVYLSDKIPVYSVYNVKSNVGQAEYDDLIYRLQCLHYNALNDSKNRDNDIFGLME